MNLVLEDAEEVNAKKQTRQQLGTCALCVCIVLMMEE